MQGIPTAEEPRSKTFAYLRSKLEAIANSGGSPLDAYDLDRFLTRGPTSSTILTSILPPRWSRLRRSSRRGFPGGPWLTGGSLTKCRLYWRRVANGGSPACARPAISAIGGIPGLGLYWMRMSLGSYGGLRRGGGFNLKKKMGSERFQRLSEPETTITWN